MDLLKINDLTAEVDGRQVLHGLNLTVGRGEVHALMGPNGSGKSSLANTLLGSRRYTVCSGKVEFEGKDLLKMQVDERARAGLYVAWQNPMTVPGLSIFSLCKTAYEVQGGRIESVVAFKNKITALLERVGLGKDYLGRGVNEGFSGGEKKRLELLQLLLLAPKLAVLDEIDSGLDIDALRLVGEVVAEMGKKGTAFILITHYKRLLEYIKPDYVQVLKKGEIVRSGWQELVNEIEEKGYGK